MSALVLARFQSWLGLRSLAPFLFSARFQLSSMSSISVLCAVFHQTHQFSIAPTLSFSFPLSPPNAPIPDLEKATCKPPSRRLPQSRSPHQEVVPRPPPHRR